MGYGFVPYVSVFGRSQKPWQKTLTYGTKSAEAAPTQVQII